MTKVVCPGSFDPVTKGHLDIIERASGMFDNVTALVIVNPEKNTTFTVGERADMLRACTAHLANVSVDSYHGLLADYVRSSGASAIVKGLRAMSDFDYEFQMALTNKKLAPGAETVFLTTSSDYLYLSSSLVKQVAAFGGDISIFVPDAVLGDIQKRLGKTGGGSFRV